MNKKLSRRWFLISVAGASCGTAIAPSLLKQERLLAQRANSGAITLKAMSRTLEVNGKAASVMGLMQPNGVQGIYAEVNRPFKVLLENTLTVPTSIHWHGLHPPNNQDGVPGITQPLVQPNSSDLYDFPLTPAGTHWMHSHQGFQEIQLLSAPLIVRDPADSHQDEQEVVVMLRDFSFRSPEEIYADLQQGGRGGQGGSGMSEMGNMSPSPSSASSEMPGMGKQDVSDVNYDAYLANDRTLADPDVVTVEKGGRVRLRIINGASGTNYFIDLGQLTGEAIATDGMAVKSVQGNRFPLAVAQRLDIRLQLPKEGGTFPILALREGAREQTGFILTTPGARVSRLPQKNATAAGLLNLDLESRLSAVNPLKPKQADRTHILKLTGNMSKYIWSINGQVFNFNNLAAEVDNPQVRVKPGERVLLKFVNETGMSHPMHLHGHSFQVTEINTKAIDGALRDTVLVPPRTSVSVAFDANNPGVWFVHCHLMWHLEAGMATTVSYEA